MKNGQAQRLAYRPDLFTVGKLVPTPLPTEDIGFSGFRLLHPVNTRRHFDEVAVFQGASYFRSVGRHQIYGLSARGLAVKVGEPSGEEFPVFRAFWIEEPAPRSVSVTVHALLDSPSVAGAYRFVIDPGEDTVMQVEAVLFPRVELAAVGLAPGTSMYMFSASERSWVDDFRPQVHDSDGLLIFNGRGEQLWRPFANPTRLEISAFADTGPRGFGLMQRDRDPAHYQDFESHFERRPSLWVEPTGDWGEGAVVLTEIPTDAEIHDNIVAFWRPQKPISAGSEFRFAYKLSWGEEPAAARDRLRVVATALGRADVKGPTPSRRVVIDYDAPQRRPCGAQLRRPDRAGDGLGRQGPGRRGGRQPAHGRLPGRLRPRPGQGGGNRAAPRAEVRGFTRSGGLALPMDKTMKHHDHRLASLLEEAAAMPREAPRPMPSQSLQRFEASSRRRPLDPGGHARRRWRRVLVFGTSLALAAYAIEEMRRALAVGRPTVVGMTVLVLFAINFTWITLPLVTSAVGFLRVVARRRARRSRRPPPRDAHGAADAQLQRGPRTHRRGAGGDGARPRRPGQGAVVRPVPAQRHHER